jgi:hypothetical protein
MTRKNLQEAFAEAYKLIKLEPARLKSANRQLFEWFEQERYL